MFDEKVKGTLNREYLSNLVALSEQVSNWLVADLCRIDEFLLKKLLLE